jgi:hypothetical protein
MQPMPFQPCPTCPDPRTCTQQGQCLQQAMGGGAGGPPPGGPPPGGAPMPMRKGGRVKKAKGGAVRGCGKASRGSRPVKIR